MWGDSWFACGLMPGQIADDSKAHCKLIRGVSERRGATAGHAANKLESFFIRSHINFLRPRSRMLQVQLPVCLGDGVDVEQSILATLRNRIRLARGQSGAVDAAIDDHMRNMQALRPEFSGHALTDHAQAGLGRSEVGKAILAAQTG